MDTYSENNKYNLTMTRKKTNAWLNDRFRTSHIEGYICAIQEQEIRTRQLINKRENPEYNPKCRFCKTMDESIFHILNSCSHLSTSMYLPVRHNEVAKVLYYELRNLFEHTENDRKTPEPTFTTDKSVTATSITDFIPVQNF